jgi:hypothetical protein
MSKLTYYSVYRPNKDSKKFDKPNFVCKDNSIHIRLKNYNKPEVISGTINKLTYLIEYLLNYCYLPNTLLDKNDTDAILNSFMNSDTMGKIACILGNLKEQDNIKVKILKVYSKKYNVSFGIMTPDVCPVGADDDGKSKCSLLYFLDSLNISLKEYLYNDGFEIHIENEKPDKIETVYSKFTNKAIRYKNKHSKEYVNVDLW